MGGRRDPYWPLKVCTALYAISQLAALVPLGARVPVVAMLSNCSPVLLFASLFLFALAVMGTSMSELVYACGLGALVELFMGDDDLPELPTASDVPDLTPLEDHDEDSPSPSSPPSHLLGFDQPVPSLHRSVGACTSLQSPAPAPAASDSARAQCMHDAPPRPETWLVYDQVFGVIPQQVLEQWKAQSSSSQLEPVRRA